MSRYHPVLLDVRGINIGFPAGIRCCVLYGGLVDPFPTSKAVQPGTEIGRVPSSPDAPLIPAVSQLTPGLRLASSQMQRKGIRIGLKFPVVGIRKAGRNGIDGA